MDISGGRWAVYAIFSTSPLSPFPIFDWQALNLSFSPFAPRQGCHLVSPRSTVLDIVTDLSVRVFSRNGSPARSPAVYVGGRDGIGGVRTAEQGRILKERKKGGKFLSEDLFKAGVCVFSAQRRELVSERANSPI